MQQIPIKLDLSPSSGHYQSCIRFSLRNNSIKNHHFGTTGKPPDNLSSIHPINHENSSPRFTVLFCFFTDPSRSIPATRTHKNPQTEGLQLPEAHKRHSGKGDGPAGQKSTGGEQRAAPAAAQQQPPSGQPQTVNSSPLGRRFSPPLKITHTRRVKIFEGNFGITNDPELL